MAKEGFKYKFQMMMEGVKIPFKNATIGVSPSGISASISIFSNKQGKDIKPKTSIQIFFQEWFGNHKGNWKMLFDGYVNAVTDTESAEQGRLLYLQARDFTGDLDKIPASVVYGNSDLNSFKMRVAETGTAYTITGIDSNVVLNTREATTGEGSNINLGAQSGYVNLPHLFKRIATTAAYGLINKGEATKAEVPGTTHGNKAPGVSVSTGIDSAIFGEGEDAIDGGFILDALARGMFMESLGSNTYAANINSRLRADKKMIFPKSKASYNMYTYQTGATRFGESIMGGSKYTSVYTLLSNVAAMLQGRPWYNTSPPAINFIKDTEAADFVIDEHVKNYIAKNEKNRFGAPYIMAQHFVLPPLELTAPPGCNIITPVMYNSVTTNVEFDRMYTRGVLEVSDIFLKEGLTSPDPSDFWKHNTYVPTNLFPSRQEILDEGENRSGGDPGQRTDMRFINGRYIPPITVEEKMRGMSIYHSQVDETLARADSKIWFDHNLNSNLSSSLSAGIDKIRAIIDGNDAAIIPSGTTLSSRDMSIAKDLINERASKVREMTANAALPVENRTNNFKNAMRRHALIKFIHGKYSGTSLQINMVFNPYAICGFPSVVIAGTTTADKVVMEDMIGQIQQIQHTISIEAGFGTASTTAVLVGVRPVKQPTDVDDNGNDVYAMATNKIKAKLNDDLEYEDSTYNPDIGKGRYRVNVDDKMDIYDTVDESDSILNQIFPYAKDVLTLTDYDKAKGESNAFIVDAEYTPNRISKFYKNVLKTSNSIMVGRAMDGNTGYNFMYDTIDEAVDRFKDGPHSDAIYKNLEGSMEFIYRDIISADTFYGGILGASRKHTVITKNNGSKDVYITHDSDGTEKLNTTDAVKQHDDSFKPYIKYRRDHKVIDDEYYGLGENYIYSTKSTFQIPATMIVGNRTEINASIPNTFDSEETGAGKLSTIHEIAPVTAFTKERRNSVLSYKSSIGPTSSYS